MKIKSLCIVAMLLCSGAVRAEDAVVAKVNGVVITSRDLDEATDDLVQRTSYHGAVTDEKRDKLRPQALTALIDEELRYQDAVAHGVRPERGVVNDRLDRIRKRYPSSRDYRLALKRSGFDEKTLRARVERRAVLDAAFAKTVSNPSRASDAELKEYYQQNPGMFRTPESVKLRIISTRNKARAKEALEQLIDGEDFGAVAALLSEDKYRARGGDIGFVHRGSIYPELEAAAFKLKPGETSGLIKAEGQWFIIKAEANEPERVKTFEDSMEGIRKTIEKKRSSELLKAWMDGLRTKAKIEYFQDYAREDDGPAK